MRFDFIPEEAKPHECAVLVLYFVVGVKDSVEIQRTLHYKDVRSVYRVLNKYRQESGLRYMQTEQPK